MSMKELEGIFSSIRDGEAAYAVPASLEEKSVGLDPKWRRKLVDWSYQVVDHYGYPREAVAVSMNILDRFSANAGLNRKLHQLAALATLHMALKSGGNDVRLQDLVALSRGYFSADQVKFTEKKVLEAVGWRVHPTMASAIIPYFSLLLPESAGIAPELPQMISDYAIFLTELAVSDSSLVAYDEISIALAATMISLLNHPVTDHQTHTFVTNAASLAGIDVNASFVVACQHKLHTLSLVYHNEEEEANMASSTPLSTPTQQYMRDSASPVGVESFQFSPTAEPESASSLKRQRVSSIGDAKDLTTLSDRILNAQPSLNANPHQPSDDMIHY